MFSISERKEQSWKVIYLGYNNPILFLCVQISKQFWYWSSCVSGVEKKHAINLSQLFFIKLKLQIVLHWSILHLNLYYHHLLFLYFSYLVLLLTLQSRVDFARMCCILFVKKTVKTCQYLQINQRGEILNISMNNYKSNYSLHYYL